jgi:HD-like signal output (HDOD) protein
MIGGGVTLARLVNLSPKGRIKVFLVCETANDLPVQVRYGLERLNVIILERHKLSLEDLESLFDEFITVDGEEEMPDELLSAEEIGKRLENDIRHMVTLPVLPQVYHKIVELDRDKSSEINDWVEAIETDPLTQAQVIRRARSPIYGFRGQIDDTSKAVVLLGKNTVKELVVSSALRRSCENLADDSFKMEEYWIHSIAVGTMARLLSFPMDETLWTPDHRKTYDEFALDEETQQTMKERQLHKRFPLESHQDPFIGGMMHDIGKIALVHAYPGIFSAIVSVMEAQYWNRPMAVAEEIATGGFNHCHVGRLLGDSWKLGNEICQIIEYHHNPSKDDAYSRLVALADFLVAGLYRYPSQARYPMTYVLEEEGADAEAPAGNTPAPPAAEKNEEESQEVPPQEVAADDEEAAEWAKIAAEDPNEALLQFMPADLSQWLDMTPNEIINLGRALTPVVRRLTERLQQSG